MCGARIVLQCGSGLTLFTGYLATAPEQQYLGQGHQGPAWRYILLAVDDSCLLDHNALPVRTPFAWRTAGDALRTLANDVLPGGLDLSGVQDVSPVNQFPIVPQKTWTEHAQELTTMARATYRAHDGKLDFQPVGQQSFTISDQDKKFVPEGLTLVQPDELRNDVTIIGELEPVVYVRDYFLGDGTTLAFYLSEVPFSKSTVTLFVENYTDPQLNPTLWGVTDPNGKVSVSGGQLLISGGPATVSYVEKLELAGGLMMQHGQVVFNAASSGTIGGIYNDPVGDGNCIAGFRISPNGSNCTIQALVNGAGYGYAAGHDARTSICVRDASVLQRGAPRSSDVSIFRASGGQRAWRRCGGGGHARGAHGARRRSQQSGNAGCARDRAVRRLCWRLRPSRPTHSSTARACLPAFPSRGWSTWWTPKCAA